MTTEDGQMPDPIEEVADAENGVQDTPASMDEVRKLRAEAKQRRLEAKSLAEELAQYKAAQQAAEQAKLTEQQQYQQLYEQEKERAAQLAAQMQQLEQSHLRQRIATEFGLPPTFASRLLGSTEDELRADAKAMLDEMPKAQVPELNGGARTTVRRPGGSVDPNQIGMLYGVNPAYLPKQ